MRVGWKRVERARETAAFCCGLIVRRDHCHTTTHAWPWPLTRTRDRDCHSRKGSSDMPSSRHRIASLAWATVFSTSTDARFVLPAFTRRVPRSGLSFCDHTLMLSSFVQAHRIFLCSNPTRRLQDSGRPNWAQPDTGLSQCGRFASRQSAPTKGFRAHAPRPGTTRPAAQHCPPLYQNSRRCHALQRTVHIRTSWPVKTQRADNAVIR